MVTFKNLPWEQQWCIISDTKVDLFHFPHHSCVRQSQNYSVHIAPVHPYVRSTQETVQNTGLLASTVEKGQEVPLHRNTMGNIPSKYTPAASVTPA